MRSGVARETQLSGFAIFVYSKLASRLCPRRSLDEFCRMGGSNGGRKSAGGEGRREAHANRGGGSAQESPGPAVRIRDFCFWERGSWEPSFPSDLPADLRPPLAML